MIFPDLRADVKPRWNDIVRLKRHDYRITSILPTWIGSVKNQNPFMAAELVGCHDSPQEETARIDAAQRCIDCQENHIRKPTTPRHDMYMATKEVWKHAVPEGANVMLCYVCLEARLGRRLRREDFTPVPINDQFIAAHPECAGRR